MSKPATQTALEDAPGPAAREEAQSAVPIEEPAANLEIETLAYRLWEERGRPAGDPERDWFEAERRITARDDKRQEG